MTYILDIETRPDPMLVDLFTENVSVAKNIKDPKKIEESIQKKLKGSAKEMSLNANYNEIICVGIKEIGKEGQILSLAEYADWLNSPLDATEKQWKDRAESTTNAAQKIITFNGVNFDIPTIIKAGIKQEMDLPYSMLIRAMDKYGNNHIDLSLKLFPKYGEYVSLDKYLKIYLGIEKETDGDEFFRTASDEEIKKHCLQDLEFTEQLYTKFLPLFVC